MTSLGALYDQAFDALQLAMQVADEEDQAGDEGQGRAPALYQVDGDNED